MGSLHFSWDTPLVNQQSRENILALHARLSVKHPDLHTGKGRSTFIYHIMFTPRIELYFCHASTLVLSYSINFFSTFSIWRNICNSSPYLRQSLCSSVPMFPSPDVPRPYIPQFLYSPAPFFTHQVRPMFPSLCVSQSLCFPVPWFRLAMSERGSNGLTAFRIRVPDSNEGWSNVGPTSVLSSRHWTNVSPTYIAVWGPTGITKSPSTLSVSGYFFGCKPSLNG